MKKTKQWMIAAIFACGITPVRAQLEQGTFSIIPRLGFLSSNLSQMPNLPINDHIELKKTLFPGFLVGADVEYQFTDVFSVAAGLSYTTAQRELKLADELTHSGLMASGSGSHRVYVLRK